MGGKLLNPVDLPVESPGFTESAFAKDGASAEHERADEGRIIDGLFFCVRRHSGSVARCG